MASAPGRKESIRGTLALEVLDVFVGQLDIALAVSGPQHMLAGMAIDDDAAAIAAAAKSIFIVASLSLSSEIGHHQGGGARRSRHQVNAIRMTARGVVEEILATTYQQVKCEMTSNDTAAA